MKDIIAHYDRLIDENHDPVHDPIPLRDYMDQYDGRKFIEGMRLNSEQSVLEIGVGSGRLAIRIAPLCKSFCGIDISPKTVRRAKENLSVHRNVRLFCDDFMSFEFEQQFDVIYSSLTWMHIRDKRSAIKKVESLLKPNGRFVLSIDKSQSEWIDMGTRKIKVYPDNPTDVCHWISEANLTLLDCFESALAYVIISKKPSSKRVGSV